MIAGIFTVVNGINLNNDLSVGTLILDTRFIAEVDFQTQILTAAFLWKNMLGIFHGIHSYERHAREPLTEIIPNPIIHMLVSRGSSHGLSPNYPWSDLIIVSQVSVGR